MLIYVEIDCINVIEKGCLCVCGVFDVSKSVITALTDMIISE